MNAISIRTKANRQSGQTLIMALIILGVLLVLGTVFLALVNRNIRGAATTQKRSESYDLAEAGIRYAHSQMLSNVLGADWRPTPTALATTGTPIAVDDPDYAYLRLPNLNDPNDYGGPDKLGAYTRLNFDRGRSLVRVRYAPSDPTVFSSTAQGDFLEPGKARNYTIIESIGRSGKVVDNDPTSRSLQSGVAVERAEETKLVGFVTTGLTEQARFITNVTNTTRPIEIGIPVELGATYSDTGTPTAVQVPSQLGTQTNILNPYDPNAAPGVPTPSAAPVPYGGGVVANGDLVVHGRVNAFLNTALGDRFVVTGSISGADNSSALSVTYARPNGNAWQTATQVLQNNTSPSLNSDSPLFDTIFGLIRDGYSSGDARGYPRSAPRIEGPSITASDAETGQNRFVQMTQSSGRIYAAGNSGRFGHGQGVFVNNNNSRQMRAEEQGREDVGSAESLVYDWLNPNNNQRGSGWKGAYYVPKGAYLRLLEDGFVIIRDSRDDRTWRMPDGSIGKRPGALMTSTNPNDFADSYSLRFKLRRIGNTTYILNQFSVDASGRVVDLISANDATFQNAGYPFNGVLYFQGNVRVRGQIPTDQQLTVLSNATIYIEGSITKGVRLNGGRINRPSKSMIALLAKDYVTLNTTQFFGPDPLQSLDEIQEASGAREFNPIRVKQGENATFESEFLLDPLSGTAGQPNTWSPYALGYTTGAPNGAIQYPQLLVYHSAQGTAGPVTFVGMDINYGLPTPTYLFELNSSNAATPFFPANYVTPGYTIANRAPVYGLGGQPWQNYPKFEGAAFPVVSRRFLFNPGPATFTGTNAAPIGTFTWIADATNSLTITPRNSVGGTPSGDYLYSRTAIVPQDVRIEAVIMAQEGSFFVIPGPWFNPDPNDRRDTYDSLGSTQAERDLARLEQFGATPDMPFYGEPLDVRVQIYGSITENLPPPISQQAEWLKKWGWIPRFHGSTGRLIPSQHVPNGYNVSAGDQYVPNLTVIYDPALATGRNGGFVSTAGSAVDQSTLIRYQDILVGYNAGAPVYKPYALPPLPRLPVSPTLAYFGEVRK